MFLQPINSMLEYGLTIVLFSTEVTTNVVVLHDKKANATHKKNTIFFICSSSID